ncbi:hypothetical protein G6F70_007847 [Rhizopus microsporus]|nr:hypothetical protein G6F71_007799 [Rhizopus microsporus]KAG1195938.1 hypothetical protein G6F70_007847 [Rhizopus microsporus]KAG1207869.1 hypothetical protein G6F69_007693 [Rhizopus microsporus]
MDRSSACGIGLISGAFSETDIHPDVIISTLIQHDFGHSIGFGEVKAGNESTTKHFVCLDVVRLGVACKRAIDQARLAG